MFELENVVRPFGQKMTQQPRIAEIIFDEQHIQLVR